MQNMSTIAGTNGQTDITSRPSSTKAQKGSTADESSTATGTNVQKPVINAPVDLQYSMRR
jgi:hypothetical protein